MNKLIYSVEDDKDIALIINRALTKTGYNVKTFYNAQDFFNVFYDLKPDMILLDIMLPDMSGMEILKKVRELDPNFIIQIIIISANHMLLDKVDGLDLGADDYIEKPFDILELMSRVNARFRRIKNPCLEFKDIKVFDDKHQVLVNKKEIELTNKEYDILMFMLSNRDRVIKREELFEQIWNTKEAIESRTLDMHVASLRNKLGNGNNYIETVYGIGYRLKT